MFHLLQYHTYQPKLYTLVGKALLFGGLKQETQLIDRIEVPNTIKIFVPNADEILKDPRWIHGIRSDKFLDENLLMTPLAQAVPRRRARSPELLSSDSVQYQKTPRDFK